MPVSPEDVLKLTHEDQKILEEIQNSIDKYVVENFLGDNSGTGGSIRFSLEKVFIEVKPKIKKKICDNYKQAGWKQVTFEKGEFFLSTYKPSGYYDR